MFIISIILVFAYFAQGHGYKIKNTCDINRDYETVVSKAKEMTADTKSFFTSILNELESRKKGDIT